MGKNIILLGIAALCVGLYFYGSYVKDNSYLKHLPTIGGLAFGLNTLVNLAQ
jgi:hypothetical protein